MWRAFRSHFSLHLPSNRFFEIKSRTVTESVNLSKLNRGQQTESVNFLQKHNSNDAILYIARSGPLLYCLRSFKHSQSSSETSYYSYRTVKRNFPRKKSFVSLYLWIYYLEAQAEKKTSVFFIFIFMSKIPTHGCTKLLTHRVIMISSSSAVMTRTSLNRFCCAI